MAGWGRRGRSVVPAVAAASVAALAAGALAVHLGPRYDELHTLSHVGHEGPVELWRSYREARDTLPPTGYVAAWAWAKVAGPGLGAARAPIVAAWSVAAAALSLLTRRAGPWASFVAGLIPSATALVYLGAFARPYAPALAAVAIGTLCWQRAAEVERAGPWIVATALAFAAASSLHYLVAPVALCATVASLLPGWQERWAARSLAPVVGAGVALLVSAPLFGRAAADQGRLDRSVRAIDAIAFWPSTLRPLGPVLLLVALVVGAALMLGRRAVQHRSAGPRLAPELVRFALLVVAVAPCAAVGVMAATSGTYVHRYGVGALIGAGILAAAGTAAVLDRAGDHCRWCGPALGVLALVGVGLATTSVASSFVSMRVVDRLPGALGLEEPSAAVVVVLDEYDHRLLRWAGSDQLDARLVLGAPATLADAPAPASVAEIDALLAAADRRPVEVVGDEAQVDALLAEHPGWGARRRAETTYVRPGSDRALGRYELVASPG